MYRNSVILWLFKILAGKPYKSFNDMQSVDMTLYTVLLFGNTNARLN